MFTEQIPSISISRSAECVLSEAKSVRFFGDVNELAEAAAPVDQLDERGFFTVGYDVDGQFVPEARVCHVKNGISANYVEAFTRRLRASCLG